MANSRDRHKNRKSQRGFRRTLRDNPLDVVALDLADMLRGFPDDHLTSEPQEDSDWRNLNPKRGPEAE